MIDIRKAIDADAVKLPAIERSAAAAFKQLPHLAWIADDSVQSVERHRELIDGGAAWVASDGDVIIGFLNGEISGFELHIWELAVSAGQQGRGIGRRLIDAAIAWSSENGFDAVTLTTFRDVRWNEPFYKSVGFQTLEGDNLSDRLRRIVADESDKGLPADERCAMSLRLNVSL